MTKRIDNIGQNGNNGDHYLFPNDLNTPKEIIGECLPNKGRLPHERQSGWPYDEELIEDLATEIGDAVEHPSHYMLAPGMEAKDVIKAVLGEDGFRYYCHGNVLKYILRARKKNGEEDFRKAATYIKFYLGE